MPRRRRRVVVSLVVVLALAAVAGLAARRYWPRSEDTGSITTEAVELGDVEQTVSALGTLQPLQYVDVGTQVSGQLQKIHVDIGDAVKQGQLLAEIDPTVYIARVDADQAQLLNLRAQIAERSAQKTLAQQQVKRQKELLDARATSQDSYDAAVANLKVLDAQIRALDAQMQQTESALRGDKANLGYTRIYAPMAGTVVSLPARQGQTLNASQQAPTLLRIADLDTVTVWTQVSEADVPKLRLGMDVYFTTLGKPEQRRYGKLRQILPTPEVVNNVVLYDALFDVPNPDHALLPQMSAEVFFVVAQAKHVPLVPVAALHQRGGAPAATGAVAGGRYRVRVLHDGKVEVRRVTTGVSDRLVAEVRSGLEPGDQVVTGGGARSRPARSRLRTPHL